jgi:deoxyadenosine/deoxycytidine kinase
MEQYHIVFGGNIGSGMGSFLKATGEPVISRILLGVFPNNDGRFTTGYYPGEIDTGILDEYYGDPTKHALNTQLHFLFDRMETYEVARNHIGVALTRRSVLEDLHVFANALVELGVMSASELRAYNVVYDRVAAHIDEPNVFVYFKASKETLMQRVMQSGSAAEQNISPRYLAAINEAYESFIQKLTCPVLVINTDTADVKHPEFHKEVAHRVAGFIRSSGITRTLAGISDWLTIGSDQEANSRLGEVTLELSELLKTEQRILSIAANVGLGKSTIARLMAEKLGIYATFEDPTDNPLLMDFLGDKKAHCLALQRKFLEMRAAQRVEAHKTGRSFVEDRSPSEDLLVFCRQFEEDGYLTGEEYVQLEREFMQTNDVIPQADLVLVLKGLPARAWRGIRKRGRLVELKGGWSRQEIENLGKWYESLPEDIRQYRTVSEPQRIYSFHSGPVLVVDQERLNIGPDARHTGYFFERILNTLKK